MCPTRTLGRRLPPFQERLAADGHLPVLHVTGHSLGGAVASLCAYDLATTFKAKRLDVPGAVRPPVSPIPGGIGHPQRSPIDAQMRCMQHIARGGLEMTICGME